MCYVQCAIPIASSCFISFEIRSVIVVARDACLTLEFGQSTSSFSAAMSALQHINSRLVLFRSFRSGNLDGGSEGVSPIRKWPRISIELSYK